MVLSVLRMGASMEKFEKVNKDIHRRELQIDTSKDVAMANQMVLHSACNLSLNEMKLLRYIIMQTKRGDDFLYQYDFNIKDLAADFGTSVKDLYRDLPKMANHIMQEVLTMGQITGNYKEDNWLKFRWVDRFGYNKGKVTIKLSDDLAPFLLHLVGSFTKYELDEIVKMNSTYAIRIYEVIRAYMDDHNLPYADNTTEISISMEVLRKITNTENKFKLNADFKRRIVDAAVKEINRCSKYHVTAEPYKNGRAVAGFDFLIESQAGYLHRQQADRQSIDEQIEGQMNITDFIK
jgi:plasmid replication initiation protein